MAAGPESMDIEDWMPSKIYLSIPLMWETLQFTFAEGSQQSAGAGLLDSSLAPPVIQQDDDEDSTIEIIVATSPEITINTADGGQEAPTLSHRGPGPSTRRSPWNTPVRSDKQVEQTDFLSFNFTPWLYADSSQFATMGDMGLGDPQPAMNENRSLAWWEGENFSNIMFNHF